MTDTAPLSVCADFFSARGCAVDAVGDPREAESILHRRRYDAVITDDDGLTDVASGINADLRTLLLTTTPDPRPLTFTKPLPLQRLYDAMHAN